MKWIVGICMATIIVFLACTNDKETINDWTLLVANEDNSSFNATTKSINSSLSKKQNLADKYRNATSSTIKNLVLDEAKVVFNELLIDKALPSWQGTIYAPQGNSPTPKTDSINESYFIANILTSIGLQLNGDELAYLSPQDIVATLSIKEDIQSIDSSTLQTVVKSLISPYPDGAYLIGQDNTSIGFVIKKKKDTYLWSTSPQLNKVTLQNINQLPQQIVNKKVYLTHLSHNRNLIKNWLLDEKIKTPERGNSIPSKKRKTEQKEKFAEKG